MNKKLNIAFGKYGKALSFKPQRWGMIGGDHEAPALLVALAQMNPDINFYLVGRSDWHKLDQSERDEYNCNGNIIDVWAEQPEIGIYSQKHFSEETGEEYKWPYVYFQEKKINIDFGVVISGPMGQCTIPNYIYLQDGSKNVAKAIQMNRRYSGPMNYFFNTSKTPFVEFGEDPRYYPAMSRDSIHRPEYIASTRDVDGIKYKCLDKPFGQMIERTINIRNLEVSHYFLASEPDKRLKEPGKRSNLMSVYSNGLRQCGGENKFPALKDYVLDQFESATIYGQWPEDTKGIEPYLGRFQETPMSELVDQMYDTKYAFMIPIKSGWPTSKTYKHLLFGMIPFFHPNCNMTYYPDMPEYLILKDANDFKRKIDFLEANPDKYRILWDKCQKMLKDEYFDGTHCNSKFLSVINEFFPEFRGETRPLKSKMSCLWPVEEKPKVTVAPSTLDSFFA